LALLRPERFYRLTDLFLLSFLLAVGLGCTYDLTFFVVELALAYTKFVTKKVKRRTKVIDLTEIEIICLKKIL